MFRLADGRDKLYQWDSNIKLLVDENFGSIDAVHFASRFSRTSLSKKIVVENSVSYVVIPNILLTKSYDIFVYAYVHGDDGNYTKFEKTFEVISRPKPSDYVYTETDVLNYLTLSNRIDLLSEEIGTSNVEHAIIHDLPTDMVAQPQFSVVDYVNTDLDTVIVKPALLTYGGRMFFPYTENIDGTTADLPTTSGDGVTAVKYRYFWDFNNSKVDDTVGIIAEKGSSYTDYNGEVQNAKSGAGYSSAVGVSGYNGKVYFSFIEDGGSAKVNDVYQTFVPCCVDVVIDTQAIGEIMELNLTIDGERGRFDLARLGYTNYHSYYTTVAPTYYGSQYHLALAVPNGIAYFTSTDGVAWEYVRTYKTSFNPYYEIAMGKTNSGQLIFACRAAYSEQKLYIVFAEGNSDSIYKVYSLDDIGSRPSVFSVSNRQYLMHSTTSRNVAEVVQIIPNGSYGLYFYRWFRLYGNMTYYPILKSSSAVNEVNSFANFWIVGNNGPHDDMKGMSWAKVSCDITLPFLADNCIYPALTVVEPGTKFTVVRDLTNCTSDSGVTDVADGESHTEKITADNGYTLDGAIVTVTMGGEDITSSVYDGNGNIEISAVTSEIIITAAAAKLGDSVIDVLSDVQASNATLASYSDGVLTIKPVGTNILLIDTARIPYSAVKGKTIRFQINAKADGWVDGEAVTCRPVLKATIEDKPAVRVKYSNTLYTVSDAMATEYAECSTDAIEIADSIFTQGTGTITDDLYFTFQIEGAKSSTVYINAARIVI